MKSDDDSPELDAGTKANIANYDCPDIMDAGRRVVRNEINEEAEELNNRIISNLHVIAEAFREHFNSKMKLSDIQTLPDKLTAEYNAMSKMIELIANSTTTTELVRKIHDYSNIFDITVPRDRMLDITNLGKYLEFIKNIGEKELEVNSCAWANPFQPVSKYLYQSQKWYTFLNTLHDRFSEYDVQKNRRTYNVANLDDWGMTDKPPGIMITDASYNEFLNKIAKFNITAQDSVKNITLTDLRLDELNHVLNLTLKHTVSSKCEDSSIILSGSYLISGESIENLYESCSNYTLKNISNVSIFALNTFFIDSRSILNPIFVIAPKWEIVDQVTIDLSGSEGESRIGPLDPSRPRTRSKAANGSRPGAKGTDGKPGGPGEPGGVFIGIGDHFLNGGNLTIKADGGGGGAGEHGGDGYNGKDGESPPDRARDIPIPCENSCSEVQGFKCKAISYHFFGAHCYGYGEGRYCYPDSYSCTYKIFGKPGEKGGDGGNGGHGGNGGEPGKVTLFELDGDSGIVKTTNKGVDGEKGNGGKGGITGSDGDDITLSFGSSSPREEKERLKKSKGIPGKNGKDGANTVGLQYAKSAYVWKEPAKIVNKYKKFSRENMIDRFTKNPRFQFLEKINNNGKVNSIYDTAGFIDEFEGLEEQIPGLREEVDFIPFYQSLLSRISEYSKNLKDGEKLSEHKKVLNYLYTATLGRIYNLKDDSESNLIVNIGGYLDIVKREIETLKDIQKVEIKAEIISKYQERYKDNLDRKIEEAKHIVEKLITPEMANISKDIDNKIDLLIDETVELERKAEEDKDALIKKKKELENAMAMRGLFSCISIFGQIVSFFGPVGAVVGTVIGATSSVVESLVLDDQQQTLEIPPGVVSNLKALGAEIKSVREKKVAYLDKLLKEVSQEIANNPKKLGDMSAKIADLKIRLNKVKENKYDFKEIKILESELKQELRNKEGQLKIKEVEPDDETKGALKVIEKLSQVAQLGSLLVDIYNKHKSDQKKVDSITDAIEKSEDQIQKLKAYEEQIYEIIVPTLQNMENNLQDVANKLEAKSQVSLDVTKWKVQSALRDMKLQMQQLTEGFQVKDNLARCIEKLEEAMNTLINVYDRIQSYQDQQYLVNYIADISSSSASSISISNSTLVEAVNHLEMLIRSNIVLTQYKAAMNAFKQWVFPFANNYLEEKMLPSHLELEKNIENLVDDAVKQIENIKSKLDLYKTSVKKTDKYIHTGEFSSHYISTKPFYVWTNEEFKDAISKLLSGQEVVFKADVRKSAFDKDAIKFSLVDLYFKTNNETMQSQINDAIKGFDIIATHLGNSYYRYADKIYVITSDSQTIWYSYEKNAAGEPVRKNIVFDKIKEGDLMLSPYTLWEFKMIGSAAEISFGDLEIYKDYVDLELSGYGSYVVQNTKGLKFSEKEYVSMGEDAYMESEAINSKKYADMTPPPDHVEAYDGYMTNGVAPSLWSPLNYFCNFLKLHIAANFVQLFIDEVKNINVDIMGDITVKRSPNLGSDNTKIKIKTAVNNMGRADLVRNEAIIIDENTKRSFIDAQGSHLSFSNGCKSFLPNGAERKINCVSQYLHVNSTLLLADLVARTVTRNKYNQAFEECLLSFKEKLQIRIDQCAIRSEDDAKRHLHNLSRMTDDRESSWLNGIKSYVKSMFQYLGYDKKSEPDESVENIRNLFD